MSLHQFELSKNTFFPRITTSTGEDISGTRLGEKLFLRIEMDQESIFGIFARNLKAISGDNEDEIELLDSRGCPTDPIIFPGLQLLPNSRDLQGSFEAFKFSDTSIVRFQVNVQFCVEQCNPVQCGEGLESFGRRRREADSTTVAPTTKVPEPYASRLVFDQNLGQEVISGDSQLSKEIIVDSGTKIDSFRDPMSQEDLGVFVKGDYSEGEVVCTTWPVVIATGAAVVFLQLCILTTCILCLYTARRGKRPQTQVAMSDRQSLHRCDTVSSCSVPVILFPSRSLLSHSGRSSVTPGPPAPSTLYHDQLTYRPPAPPSSYSR